jgi:DNA-binding response OmpR family regulator
MTKTPLKPRRVLIADDNEQVRSLLVDLLEQEGYEVLSASDGRTALDLALSNDLDVVVSDVVMPVLDGIELCRRLKRHVETSRVPVLLISGLRRSSEDGLKGLTAGADDYLDVPFRNEAFPGLLNATRSKSITAK